MLLILSLSLLRDFTLHICFGWILRPTRPHGWHPVRGDDFFRSVDLRLWG